MLFKRMEETKRGLNHKADYDNDTTVLLTSKLDMLHGLGIQEIVV